MKRFSEFIKEEIDLKGNSGIPDDFIENSDKQAERNLGIRVDQQQQLNQLVPQIGRLIGQTGQIMMARLNPTQLEERWTKLEELAKNIVLDEIGDILESSEKPVELIIKLIRPWLRQSVTSELPELSENDANSPDEVIRDSELKKSVDKKKLLNSINQGYAKSTKRIIQSSDRVRPTLSEIFGQDADRIYTLWLETTDVADKMDWVVPIDTKGEMMKNAPQGMAGACQVKWEKEDKNEEDDKEDDNKEDTQSQGESDDYTKIVIKAVGVDFPMLLHEAFKGIFQLLQSGSIKEDEELAKFIAKNTESFEDESQDFRYGPVAQSMLREFVLTCKDCDKYSNMDARIYAKLALDKDRGGEFTDGEFLEITKSIFSCFDIIDNNTLEFNINMEKFNISTSKRKIERIISSIIADEKEYEKKLSEWEMETQFSKDDSNDSDYNDIDDDEFNSYLSDYGISSSNTTEPDIEDEDDIDDLLDKLNAAKTQAEKDIITSKLNKLMESLDNSGRVIYQEEIRRITEGRRYKK